MEKILGLDTGTNSLGWAIVSRDSNGEYKLLERGSHIFQEGVKIEKGVELSRAAERTGYRALRRHYWRRKVRKIRVLTVLSNAGLCPPLSASDLHDWRLKGIYPTSEEFRAWQLTSDTDGVNPYAYRNRCLHEQLDLSRREDRYVIGRALYHICQRRGFLSNRKDTADEKESGVVKAGISELLKQMEQEGCQYLGEYFYKLYGRGERIRTHYTARIQHYLAEFRAICERQQLAPELVQKLEKAIFFQRPLKSQKQHVGACTFEPQKARCSASHPLYEQFRMLSLVNNIKIKTPDAEEMRPLSPQEKEKIYPLFYGKQAFKFEKIAQKLVGKNNYCWSRDNVQKQFVFNYAMDTSVPNSPVTAGLRGIFGDNWLDAICEVYTQGVGKTHEQILDDVWHALFAFEHDSHLEQFAHDKLQLDVDDAKKFTKIKVTSDYASLSLKAIRNILPYMRDWGLKYSEAVFLGRLQHVVPATLWADEQRRDSLIGELIGIMHSEPDKNDPHPPTTEERLKNLIAYRCNIANAKHIKLYHPSMIDYYPKQRRNAQGIYQLGSPRISAVRNPMAMHSIFRLRHVVNALLRQGKIDEDTIVHIEFARELNDANRRSAIASWQRINEKKRAEYRKKIAELYAEQKVNREPSDTDILKYQLWEEQEHHCVYTGKEIALTDFLSDNPTFDIEHTVPRSCGGDTTQENLTLCEVYFNREVKRNLLPSQLQSHDEIMPRIAHWKVKADQADRNLRKLKGQHPQEKAAKDAVIQKRHLAQLERNYWRGKYHRFEMTEVPEGFSRRQGTDISVISRYARLYLKSVFRRVDTVRGIATSDFRKLWGLQDEYSKKARVNHVHHCIDAVTIACIGPGEYAKLAEYYHKEEDFRLHGGARPHFPKPWPTFTQDLLALQDGLLVTHHTRRTMGKHTCKKDKNGQLQQGDTARGSLHLATYYGAISVNGEVKYVQRKRVADLDEKDIKNVVDPAVAAKLSSAINEYKSLKEAVEKDALWMNKEKGVRIVKVRVFARSVTRPNHIRTMRDESPKPYKRGYHVANDVNYMMAIYEGQDLKGKIRRKFEIVSNLHAANFMKKSSYSCAQKLPLVPETSPEGYPLVFSLKVGTMVLLHENSPEEVWGSTTQELQRRLYKVVGLSSTIITGIHYGTLELLHNQEARQSKELKAKNGAYQQQEELRPKIKMLHTQIKCLVAGQDFDINVLGDVVFKNK